MKITISNIFKRGEKDEERLSLKVLTDTNLTYFVVLQTAYTSPQAVGAGWKSAFWFKPQPVKAGDLVVLYTKPGTPSTKKKDDGTTIYFYYWNRANPLWVKTGDCAVLMEVDSWVTSAYE